jgi:hypothetical protein
MNTRTATCSCGQLTLTVRGEPIRVSVCHCLACQRRTGSVFGAQARFPRSSVTISGRSTEYVRTGDEGSRVIFSFCPQCGATVHYSVEGYDEKSISVPLGAFADPEFPVPSFSVYEERMHSWVSLPAGVHMRSEHTDGNPPLRTLGRTARIRNGSLSCSWQSEYPKGLSCPVSDWVLQSKRSRHRTLEWKGHLEAVCTGGLSAGDQDNACRLLD